MFQRDRPIWQLAYDLDFADLAAQDLLTGGNGSKTIDGKAWNATRIAALSACDLDGSTGLVCAHGATSTSHNADDGSEPLLSLRLNQIDSRFDVDDYRYLLRVYATDNADAATELWGAALSKYEFSTQQWGGATALGHNGTSRIARVVMHRNTAFSNTDGNGTGHNVVAQIQDGMFSGRHWSGAYSSGFPRLSSMTFLGRSTSSLSGGTTITGAYGSDDNIGIHLWLQSGNTSANFSVTFRRLQLWVLPTYALARLP